MKRIDPILLILAALLVLLPGLAWLQYSWIAEVEQSDAVRMRAALQRSTDALQAEFNGEGASFYREVLAGSRFALENVASDPCRLFQRWKESARVPRLIQALYIVNPESRLTACVPESGQREPAEWTKDLEAALAVWFHPGGAEAVRGSRAADIPLLLAPVRPPHSARRPRPGLPGGEFPPPAPFGAPPREPGGRQRLPMDGPPRRDGAEPPNFPFGGVRPGPAMQPGGPGRPDIAIAVPDLAWIESEWIPSLVKKYVGDPSDPNVRLDTTLRRTSSATPAEASMPSDARARLFSAQGWLSAALSREPSTAFWELSVRRREGSVSQAAARVRNRNIAVSAGVLVSLAATLIVLLLTLRRQRRLAQQQMEFVAGVSHELRTPVAVLSSAGENLADGVVTKPEAVREYGAMIRDEARRLAGMVEQTLRFAGIQSGRARYKRQPVDVAEAARAALRNNDALLRESGCSVERQFAPGLALADADPSALTHAIGNLLSNAARYASTGCWIRVRTRADGARICIDVEDRGPGIDPRDLQHLFEPFYRGRHSRERQIQGTGLGLSLVKNIMEDLDGRVLVTSHKGQGSVFTLVLRAAGAQDSK